MVTRRNSAALNEEGEMDRGVNLTPNYTLVGTSIVFTVVF